MNRYSSQRDLTARINAPGGGMSHDKLHMCGHKGSTTGALFKHGLWMKCATCNAKTAASKPIAGHHE